MTKLLSGSKLEGEEDTDIEAFNYYASLGYTRTLELVYEKFKDDYASLKAIEIIRTRFKWTKRILDYDKAREAYLKNNEKEVMSKGLSLRSERLLKLFELAKFLEGEIFSKDDKGNYFNVWLKHHKRIGRRLKGEEPDSNLFIEYKFNDSLISQYRGTLDDIAKEVLQRNYNPRITEETPELPFDLDDWLVAKDERMKEASDTVKLFSELEEEINE